MADARALLVVAGMLASNSALALPWHIDLADAKTVKAYEERMRPLPEGVMSQTNMLTPIAYRRNFTRESSEGQGLANPLQPSEAVMATGARMYDVYCTPCHGDGAKLGPVAAPGRYPAVAILKGAAGRVEKVTDGHLYLTVRNGGGLMPGYGWAMNEDEIWSLVAWMRKEFADGKLPVPAVKDPEPTDAEAAPAEGEETP